MGRSDGCIVCVNTDVIQSSASFIMYGMRESMFMRELYSMLTSENISNVVASVDSCLSVLFSSESSFLSAVLISVSSLYKADSFCAWSFMLSMTVLVCVCTICNCFTVCSSNICILFSFVSIVSIASCVANPVIALKNPV